MKRTLQGYYETVSTLGEPVDAFAPDPLPPVFPLNWTPGLRNNFDETLIAPGRLDSASVLLPEVSLFLYTYIRKEAVLSLMIAGTHSSLSDLLLFELEDAPGIPRNDTLEVSKGTEPLAT